MRLKKGLGLLGVFCMAAGSMISSGLFVLPGIAFEACGPAVILAYALASVLMIPSVFSQAELATAMPKAGGSYFFIERSMGPLPGTLAGLANWLSIVLKSSFALLGLGAYASLIAAGMTDFQVRITAVAFCVVFTTLNLLGIKKAGRAQIVLVIVVITFLCAYLGLGIRAVNLERFLDFVPNGLGAVAATAGMVFVSFVGLTKIANIAEEIRNPGRNIPLGTFVALLVVSGLYILVVFVTVGLVEPQALAGSLTPISLGASALAGRVGSVALAIVAILAFSTSANSGIASASRAPMAMSRDGLLPGFLMKISTGGVPYASILFTSGIIVTLIAFLSVKNLVRAASTMMLLLLVFVNIAVIVMRESRIQGYRPVFRSPFYPWIQIAAIGFYAFLIVEMGLLPMVITGVFSLLATGWFAAYCKVTAKRQSALVHLVQRITSRELVDGSLESELRKIVHERDEIVEDRFDRLIRQCEVLDIPRSVSAKEMFEAVANVLAPRLGLTAADLLDLLLERERESGTIVDHGIAIPHVVLEGEHLFNMVLVRCKGGISFSDSAAHVHTAFVLVGSRDERNYHLRALMAIAQLAQEHGFEQIWLQATSVEQMKNTLLLSKRRRARE